MSRTAGREMLHVQGLQYSDAVFEKFSESQLADLAGNGLLGILQEEAALLELPLGRAGSKS